MVASIDIGGRTVGSGHPCFIIAEAGVNHNGEMTLARQLVDAAWEVGADAVKFQTFRADQLATADAPKAEYQERTTESGESQVEMLRRLELGPEMHRELLAYCNDRGILFMSSAFDQESVDLLAELDVAVYKVPSGEITNLPLLTQIARNSKPMIVSTGMANLGEVETAVHAIKDEGNQDLVLLQCVSNYPADPKDVNLRAMGTLAAAFDTLVGYSDHTTGIEVAIAAVAMGACVIEKHLTLDTGLPGPDHMASIEPDEFAAMVRGVRTVEAAMGHGRKEPAASEANTAAVARKSLVASRDIPAGTLLSEEDIAVKRPGMGLPPAMRTHLLGRTARASISAGALIVLEDLA